MMDLAGEKRGFVWFVWGRSWEQHRVGPQKYHMVVFNEALPGSFVPFSDGFLYIYTTPSKFSQQVRPLEK